MGKDDRSARSYGIRALQVLLILALLMGFCGCLQLAKPGEADLDFAIPPEWTAGVDSGPRRSGWLESLADPRLEMLINQALRDNFSLRAALARMDQAAALARIEGANRWPSLSLSGTGQRQMSNNRSEPVLRTRTDRFDLDLRTTWELDLWGRVRAQAAGAEARAFAAEGDYRAFLFSLANLVARVWFNAIEARQQEALALETLTSFESNLITVEERFQRGLSPALDLRLTRANVASARASYAQEKRLADLAVRQLESLLGQYPSGSMSVPDALPTLGEPLPAGLPADLLWQRPDLEAAAQRVMAAQADLIESKRSLLPSISLTASYGRASQELEDLLDDNFDVWNLLGNITAPLFQGGRLRAGVDLSDARLREVVASYQDTALVAFREVESALASETLLREQLSAVDSTVEESVGAQQLAEERYERGLVDIITVLESQRRAYNARISALSVQNALLQNRLSLYLALGTDPYAI